MIHQEVGGTLVAFELGQSYPSDYDATVRQVSRENETGCLPRLKTTLTAIFRHYNNATIGFDELSRRSKGEVAELADD
jgi:hypothetical protein